VGKPEEVRAVGIPRHQLENNSDIRFKKKNMEGHGLSLSVSG
jgi:hypothetical protein